jgi:superfamily II DNA/RNA helicase
MYKPNRSFRARKYPRQKSSTTKNSRTEYIDPSRFVRPATYSDAIKYVPKNTMAGFELHPVLENNLKMMGYSLLSPIQDQAIPLALEGKDIIGIASTGTGKTAAFAIPLLQKLLINGTTKALIIAPTRELAQQIEMECKTIAKGSRIFGALLIGGTSMGNQLRDLRQSPKIVIGTPGRIKDHLQRGTLKLSGFNFVVLDEVDRMLDMGFVNDVTTILSETNPDRQSQFFSATMDSRVRTLINNFTKNPTMIEIKASRASENVHQNVVMYQSKQDKINRLHDLLTTENVKKVLVFDETQRGVERLNKELIARGFNAESIHGGKTQGQRQRALSKFKQNDINILVATDVAARGIDVNDITHVVNYSLPKVYNDYIHRIGRAGRAGRVGYALTFIGT